MKIEKIVGYANTLIEVVEILATGKLIGALSRLGHAKKIDEVDSTPSEQASKTPTANEAPAIKHSIGGLGPKDNIIRENTVNLLDHDRQIVYRNFEEWLRENHTHTWAALMHFVTVQAEYDPRGAQATLEHIVDVVLSAGQEEGLKYVQGLTDEVATRVLKTYGKKFLGTLDSPDLKKKAENFRDEQKAKRDEQKAKYEAKKAKYEAKKRR